MTPSYLFVLCPPYSGSTLLWRLLSTSAQVSALPSEGQMLPEVSDVMRARPWAAAHELPWARIKEVWDRHWDKSKPFWIEKSPPNLIRVDAIRRHFDPVHFVVMVRDPYAHSEGLMRRNGWDARRAAEFSAFCLEKQAENAEKLERSLAFTYEELVEDPRAVRDRLLAFQPGLGQIDLDAEFTIHSVDGDVTRRITNLNRRKIERLSPSDVSVIGDVLRGHGDAMAYWGYQSIEAGARATDAG